MMLTGRLESLYNIFDWLMKFMTTNIIWVLFNFPIAYAILSMVFAKTQEEVYLLAITILALFPFVFFPATTAMFGVVREWVMKREKKGFIRAYWNFYKENYIRSLLGGVFFTITWVVWLLNYHLAAVEIGSGLFYFFIAITIFIVAFTSYFFADTVHFEVSIIYSIRKALFMAIFHLPYTIAAAGAVSILLYIIYQIHPLFLVLFSGPAIAYVYFFAFYQIFLKAQAATESQ